MLIVDGGDQNVRRLSSALQSGGKLELVLVSGSAGGEQELGEVPHEGLLADVVPVNSASSLNLHVGLRGGGEGKVMTDERRDLIMLTYFVFLQPGVHILDDVRLVLQLVDEALQLGEVSRVIDGLHS